MRPAAGSSRDGRPGRVVRLRERGERGSVTAELALGLPAVVLALLVVLLAASAGLTQVRCGDAARAAARAAALGEDAGTVAALAQELAGPQAQVAVSTTGGWVRVTVTHPVATGWLGGGGLTAEAEAAVPLEPGTAAPASPAVPGGAVAARAGPRVPG